MKLVKLDGGTTISSITRVISEEVESTKVEAKNKTLDAFEKKDNKWP